MQRYGDVLPANYQGVDHEEEVTTSESVFETEATSCEKGK